MSDDLRTVSVRADVDDLSGAPMIPLEDGDIAIDGFDVLGGVKVQNADKDGIWQLTLEAGTAIQAFRVTEVDDRLTPGTYALVRLEAADD